MGLFSLRNARDGWTPPLRRQYFAALAEMPRFVAGEGMPKFLAHLREESHATLSDSERAALADVLDAKDDAGETAPPPSRPLVKKWSMADFAETLKNSAQAAGDAQRGAIVFRDALCARCHRVGARGPAVGPDLTFLSRRFSRRDMLESILAPSQVVAEHYRSVHVQTKDGREIIGRVLIEGDFRSETLRIAADPLRPSLVVEVNKRDIDQYRLADISPMPTGLLDGFEASEILDLLAYLEAGLAK
jgi:putative heme-binding domain-containing protein